MRRRETTLPTIEEALQRYWGYADFRPTQRNIIESVMARRDTLALLPTGGGKSLTYQIPALCMRGTCIVVTPLIALMKDQVDRLCELGVSAVAIHSGMSHRQIDVALDNCAYGNVKLLYVAPERLVSPNFRIRLRQIEVSLLAIDEAHCISQWGYDFRPSYRQISDVRGEISNAPVLALTASATRLVCDDIMKNLSFRTPNIYQGSFARHNLSYAIRRTDDKNGLMLKILSSVEGSTIVYVRTRKGCEEIAEFLNLEGVSATFYHGGLPHAERSLRQDEWIEGDYRVMVATNAFGMGIDKPDVRLVIHYTMCDSVEAYYQEAGRAGRDGGRSYAVLLNSPDDHDRVLRSLDSEFPSLDTTKSIYDKICSSLGIVYGEGGDTTYAFDMKKFCRDNHIYSRTVHSAIRLLQMNDYLTWIEEMANPARIMFIVSRDDLYKIRHETPQIDQFIRVLLRIYDGVFSGFRAIDESYIADTGGYTTYEVRDMLKQLWRMRIIRYSPTNHSAMICMERHRVMSKDLFISPETYKYRKELYHERLRNMAQYSDNETQCRSQMLEVYFGIENAKECGCCDTCLARRRSDPSQKPVEQLHVVEKMVLGLLGQSPHNIKELAAKIPLEASRIVTYVDTLIANGDIEIDSAGRYLIK
ncbi:MAG: ATP-dependent DNA helicase RecQ [Rikenellaceae bacterium]